MATFVPSNRLRGLVSKKKKRFQEGGYDLDLSYITDNIIAMGFPSESLEGIYRNPMKEVQKFMDELHGSHYKIYNLCSERRYDHSKFQGRVREFPFDDHNPCPLALILEFCRDVHEWLNAHPENVVAIHCKAGKGRTGMMICCYLQHAMRVQSASEALQLFAAKRTHNKKGVTLHSQRRYVTYYEKIAPKNELPEPNFLKLERIRMHTIPVFKKGGSEPWFSISKGNNTIYYSDPIKGKKGNQVVDFNCGMILTNDIKIEFYHKDLKGKMFYFWFHTSYVKGNYFCLRKRDLEQACKDTACKHFQQSFKIELFFKAKDENDPQGLKEAQSEIGACGHCGKTIVAEDASVELNGKFFHWACLSCDKCGKSFSGNRNCIIKDGKAVCVRCEEDEFFSSCNACFRPLTSQRNVEIDSCCWHHDCFRCAYCAKLLDHKDPNTYAVLVGTVFCPEHKGMAKGKVKCMAPACPTPTQDIDMLNVLGGHFHTKCFRCVECKRQINPKEDDFIDRDGFPCCRSHTMIPCYGCKLNVARADALTAFNEAWHSACLKCAEPGCTVVWTPDTAEELAEMKQGQLICKEHGLVCCYHCKKRVPPQQLLEVDGREMHLSCFRCATCQNVITSPHDPSTYFMKDGKPNCNSHQLKCARCAKFIESKDLVEAKGTNWHANCFTCQLQHCVKPLDPALFVVIKGKNYCATHPQCTRCRNPVRDDDQYEDHNGTFHKSCYRCGKCNGNIDPANSAFLGNTLLCKQCHPAPCCARCDGILDKGHLVMGSQCYHEECFCCSECGVLFPSTKDPISLNEKGLPICQDCIKPSYMCYTCNKGIFSQVLETLGRPYHPECFRCENCHSNLSGAYALLDDHVVCQTCSQNLQRTKCDVCNELLSGKYLLVGEAKIHQKCAPCAKCNSLIQLTDRKVTLQSATSLVCGSCSSGGARGSQFSPAGPRKERTSTFSAKPPTGVPRRATLLGDGRPLSSHRMSTTPSS